MTSSNLKAAARAGARAQLEVLGSLHIETPAGPVELSGRGSTVTLDLQRASTLRGLWRTGWDARRFIPRFVRQLDFAGLDLVVQIGTRRIASMGGRRRSGWAGFPGLRGVVIHPGALLSALLA